MLRFVRKPKVTIPQIIKNIQSRDPASTGISKSKENRYPPPIADVIVIKVDKIRRKAKVIRKDSFQVYFWMESKILEFLEFHEAKERLPSDQK